MNEDTKMIQMRQFFLNFTAEIAQDITSSVYSSIDQIGANFFGSSSDHCTTRPIWIRSINNAVSLHSTTDYGYNFPWGVHKKKVNDSKTTKMKFWELSS